MPRRAGTEEAEPGSVRYDDFEFSGGASGLGAEDVGAEPGAERFGDDDGAVGLLVLLDDRGQQAAGGEAGRVQGVDEGGALALLGPVPDVGPAGLVVPGP